MWPFASEDPIKVQNVLKQEELVVGTPSSTAYSRCTAPQEAGCQQHPDRSYEDSHHRPELRCQQAHAEATQAQAP